MPTSARYDGVVEWYDTFRPSLNEDELDALRRFLGPGRYDTGPAINPDGLRARVGAMNLPLGVFVQAFAEAGFQIQGFEELGSREYPYEIALRCRR